MGVNNHGEFKSRTKADLLSVLLSPLSIIHSIEEWCFLGCYAVWLL
jgi:hypothetical protein